MNGTGGQDRPQIEYPTVWVYKVIGSDAGDLHRAVAACIADWSPADAPERDWRLAASRTSAKGRYVSLRLELTVQDEIERDALFGALSRHPAVRMVL